MSVALGTATAGIGDIVCQGCEIQLAKSKARGQLEEEEPHPEWRFDQLRAFCFTAVAVPANFYYTLKVIYLDIWFGSSSSLGITLKKALVGNAIDVTDAAYWAVATGCLEKIYSGQKYTVEDLKVAFRTNFFLSYLWNWLFWIPVDVFLTYRYIPLAWQVPFGGCMNLCYSVGLSWILHRYETHHTPPQGQLEPSRGDAPEVKPQHDQDDTPLSALDADRTGPAVNN